MSERKGEGTGSCAGERTSVVWSWYGRRCCDFKIFSFVNAIKTQVYSWVCENAYDTGREGGKTRRELGRKQKNSGQKTSQKLKEG